MAIPYAEMRGKQRAGQGVITQPFRILDIDNIVKMFGLKWLGGMQIEIKF